LESIGSHIATFRSRKELIAAFRDFTSSTWHFFSVSDLRSTFLHHQRSRN
jgi:hypothetical protein